MLSQPKTVEWNAHGYIRTFTGGYFYPQQPEQLVPDIRDIAHALSLVCRYNGHLKDFYSVGQHSLIVEKHATQVMKDINPNIHPSSLRLFSLQALLHDATEAYIPDMPSPIKQFLPDFKSMEKRLQKHLMKSFGLPENIHSIIHSVDKYIRRDEIESMQNWDETFTSDRLSKFKITPERSKVVEQAFLSTYYEIVG